MKYFTPPPPKVKSEGQKFAESILLALLAVFIYVIIAGFIKILFWPFKYLTMSNADIYEEDKKKARQKIKNREEFLERYRSSDDNPLTRTDCDEWYKEWIDGKVIDSRLLWTPDVYIKDASGCKRLNSKFVSYLALQKDLHNNSPWANRLIFRLTLDRYYPELSYKTLASDVEALKSRIEAQSLSKELSDELIKMGLDENNAQEIAFEKLSADDLKNRVSNIRKGLKRGYSSSISVALDKIGVDMSTEKADIYHELMVGSEGMPVSILEALVHGDIDMDSFISLKNRYHECSKVSDDLIGIATLLGYYLETEKEDCRSKMNKRILEKKYGSPKWER